MFPFKTQGCIHSLGGKLAKLKLSEKTGDMYVADTTHTL